MTITKGSARYLQACASLNQDERGLEDIVSRLLFGNDLPAKLVESIYVLVFQLQQMVLSILALVVIALEERHPHQILEIH
jgi:hypothetical protein